jgi:molybdopterin-guanine dinucleotide biosynthesis protein A
MLKEPVAAVLLAGGQGRRLGGIDKMLIDIDGTSLLDHVIKRLAPQVAGMLLNANGDPRRFSGFGLPVRPDSIAGGAGPLAGILTGLEWLAETHPHIGWLLSVATDCPRLPEDLVIRLQEAVDREDADIGRARSGEMSHPVFALWPVTLAGPLRQALVRDGVRKIGAVQQRYRIAEACWPWGIDDPFYNINTAEDLVRFRLMMQDALPAIPPAADHLPVSIAVGLTNPPLSSWLTLVQDRLPAYRQNLATLAPRLFVSLIETADGTQAGLVTADEEEAAASGGKIVTVPMPPDVEQRILFFLARHPPAPPERRRKRGAC